MVLVRILKCNTFTSSFKNRKIIIQNFEIVKNYDHIIRLEVISN